MRFDMLQDERHRLILDSITKCGKITISEICDQFGISEMTARRDLVFLDRQGLLRRVYGGAVSNLGRSYEPPFGLRATQDVDAKCAIGRKAAEMVYDGDSIALDVGTTTLEVARALHGKRNLTIVTSSLPIANEIIANFSLSSDVRLILSGGIVRPREFSMIGHIAENTFREFHVDKAFIGIGGVSLEEGLTEYNLEDTLVKRLLLKSAKIKIVVSEGTKFGRTTFASVGPLSEIQYIITDSSIPKKTAKALLDMGIEVVIAD
jgi:DeoR/GlpR family transcriptional regulator of sugar metabolism